ncbi:MAG: sigma-70 family RNA polymerase sigma factor [Verrucomicrobiales bacterium]|nr:sigma-70 family RNA polymerase sigma factor [Verrucomicrobiales bacterium]
MKNSHSSEHGSSEFADLMAEHQPRLAGYIRALVGEEHAAKDVLQETNVTLLKKSREFTPGSNFAAWSLRVAYFEVLTWRRSRGRERLSFGDELVDSLAETVETLSTGYEARLNALKTCLAQLPDRQRQVVERRYLQAESVQEIAKDLGFKANAASQLLFRARTNLQKCIEKQTQSPSSAPSPS